MTKQCRFGHLRFWPWLAAWLAAGFLTSAFALDLKEAQQLLITGNYNLCITEAREVLSTTSNDEEWQVLLSRALLATGKYPEARTLITNVLAHEPRSLAVRWLAREILLKNGQTVSAQHITESILELGSSRPWAYRDDAPSLVAFAQALLQRGVDPKGVLDVVLANARKINPKLRDVYLAAGQLALDKHDFELAAKKFEEGLKELPDDPDLHFGIAKAFAPSDQALMLEALDSALEKNSNHVGSLLLLADHNIDAEEYSEAEKLLDRVEAINPWDPDAWAYRAVLAHLTNKPDDEKSARDKALKFWPENPRVDYLLGQKLSQNYRFAEAAAHQRQALKFDEDYLPAKAQLAQDLLRLGEETEGWKLAEEVQKKDGYDVQAFNLTSLHDRMATFATLTNINFLLRMGNHEAAVYGQLALTLLEQARSNLCAKYSVELKRQTIVEIFPEQKDFAVRTFGMPGNPGYLGVCFGPVATANSPASQPGHPVNWQAVLWHEFCHVVTLQITANKMPRWLSEGISVYEEIQANPAWGQRMDPDYRQMVLDDELTPVSKLSGAFLAPRSDLHLQFAYFESSLVVQFLVHRFGIGKLKEVLRQLGQGVEINQALANSTEPIDKLDTDFAAFARDQAEKLAPAADFDKPESLKPKKDPHDHAGHQPGNGANPAAVWNEWAKARPTNFWVLTQRAQELVEEKKWAQAKPVLEQVLELYPGFVGPDSAYRLLAAADRALGETNAEREVLSQFAEKDKEASDAYFRLVEIDAEAKDWAAVILNARRYIAVNPLVAAPYRFLAQGGEASNDTPAAIAAYRALLQLQPTDPAEIHFKLARCLHHVGDPEARRQVLQALEEAPRYRAALELLLEINKESPRTSLQRTATAANTAQ